MAQQVGYLKTKPALNIQVGDIIPIESGELFPVEHLKFVDDSRVLLEWGGRARTVRSTTRFLVLKLN